MSHNYAADGDPLKHKNHTLGGWSAWLGLIGAAAVLLSIAIYVPMLIYPALTAHALNQLHVSAQSAVTLQDEKYALQNNARTALIQIIAGIAVLSGATVAWRQLRHSVGDAKAQRNAERQRFYLEHYSKAIQCIGDSSATVRLGGVHLLALLAEISADHRMAVSNVLASFISNRSPWPPVEDAPAIGTPPSRLSPLSVREPDIQGAVTAITTYGAVRRGLTSLRLDRCDLRAANMANAYLDDVDLTKSHLEGAELQNASLARAILVGACLVGTNLSGADLAEADLRGAELQGATVTALTLTGAIFDDSTVWPPGFTAVDAERLGARPADNRRAAAPGRRD